MDLPATSSMDVSEVGHDRQPGSIAVIPRLWAYVPHRAAPIFRAACCATAWDNAPAAAGQLSPALELSHLPALVGLLTFGIVIAPTADVSPRHGPAEQRKLLGRIVRNVGFLGISQVLTWSLALIYTLVVARLLGPAGIG